MNKGVKDCVCVGEEGQKDKSEGNAEILDWFKWIYWDLRLRGSFLKKVARVL